MASTGAAPLPGPESRGGSLASRSPQASQRLLGVGIEGIHRDGQGVPSPGLLDQSGFLASLAQLGKVRDLVLAIRANGPG